VRRSCSCSRPSRRRFATSVAALLALLATAGSLVVSLGMPTAFRCLSGGTTIPMSLPTALAFVLLGAGEISLAVRALPTLGGWSGDSTRGMLITRVPANHAVLHFWLKTGCKRGRGVSESGAAAFAHRIGVLCLDCGHQAFWTARRAPEMPSTGRSRRWRESESQYRELVRIVHPTPSS